MSWPYSEFGRRFARYTGALELMDDLGHAVAGDNPPLLLGGGNPGRIPAVEAVFRRRLAELAANEREYARAFANYAHPGGELRFRATLAASLAAETGWDISAENVAVTGGSQSSFFLLFNLLAGDFGAGIQRRILLPLIPEYIGYADVGLAPELFRAEQPSIELLDEQLFKYHVDFDALAVDEAVAAVCVSRPTNPTGNVLTDAEMVRLDALCRARGIPFIVDNAYGLPFPDIVFSTASLSWNENTIYCMSLSKLGLPGVRTGIIVARPEICHAIAQMTATMSLAVGSVGPTLVEPMLRDGSLMALARNEIRPFYESKANRALGWLREALAGLDYRIHRPEGAIFLWLWLPGLPGGSEALYEQLKQAGVLVLSGHHFFPGLQAPWAHAAECLRISFAMDDEVVCRGMEIIGQEVRRLYD